MRCNWVGVPTVIPCGGKTYLLVQTPEAITAERAEIVASAWLDVFYPPGMPFKRDAIEVVLFSYNADGVPKVEGRAKR